MRLVAAQRGCNLRPRSGCREQSAQRRLLMPLQAGGERWRGASRGSGGSQLVPGRRRAAQALRQAAPRDTLIVPVQVVLPRCVAIQHPGRWPRRVRLCTQPRAGRPVARHLPAVRERVSALPAWRCVGAPHKAQSPALYKYREL